MRKGFLVIAFGDGMICRMFAGLWAPLLAVLWFSSSEADKTAAPPLAPAVESPNPWFWLKPYDGTMTRAEFEREAEIYDPFHALASLTEIDDSGVTFYPSATDHRVPQFRLAFAPPAGLARRSPLVFGYRTPADFRALRKPEGKPLAGLRLAIDPGHIGGQWGQVEDRSIFYYGIGRLQEGDLNLITAKILEKRLTDLGAEVFLTRREPEPVTTVRPEQLREEAIETLLRSNPNWAALSPERQNAVMRSHIELMTHLLFERKYEFLARASKIRDHFHPDLTVVLYINATPSSGRGHLIGVNQNIFFVEGAYTAVEVADPDERLRLVYKLFDRVSPVEEEVAERIADAFTRTTGLKPVGYGDSTTTRLVDPTDYYVVARNLGANRQYDGPVVTTEPYFMNHRTTAERLVAGDYEGERMFGGQSYQSIFREYADCVIAGLLASYGNQPLPPPTSAPTPTPTQKVAEAAGVPRTTPH